MERLRSLGLVATCNYDGGGNGKWSKAYGKYLRGRHVVIIPDEDSTGREHVMDVANKVTSVAASVRVLELFGLPPKGDVSDWLDASGSADELRRLAVAVPLWQPQPEAIMLARPTKAYNDAGNTLFMVWDARTLVEKVLSMDLLPQEKLLLIVLGCKIAKPRPTQRTIARAMNLSPGRVKKMLASLRERGIVHAIKLGRENEYAVRVIGVASSPYRSRY